MLLIYAIFGGWVGWISVRLRRFRNMDPHRAAFIGFIGALIGVALLETTSGTNSGLYKLPGIPWWIKLIVAGLSALVILAISQRFRR